MLLAHQYHQVLFSLPVVCKKMLSNPPASPRSLRSPVPAHGQLPYPTLFEVKSPNCLIQQNWPHHIRTTIIFQAHSHNTRNEWCCTTIYTAPPTDISENSGTRRTLNIRRQVRAKPFNSGSQSSTSLDNFHTQRAWEASRSGSQTTRTTLLLSSTLLISTKTDARSHFSILLLASAFA